MPDRPRSSLPAQKIDQEFPYRGHPAASRAGPGWVERKGRWRTAPSRGHAQHNNHGKGFAVPWPAPVLMTRLHHRRAGWCATEPAGKRGRASGPCRLQTRVCRHVRYAELLVPSVPIRPVPSPISHPTPPPVPLLSLAVCCAVRPRSSFPAARLAAVLWHQPNPSWGGDGPAPSRAPAFQSHVPGSDPHAGWLGGLPSASCAHSSTFARLGPFPSVMCTHSHTRTCG